MTESRIMMGYEGRCVLLEDADEWVNIPFVVREFMKQLNDEAQASRSVAEKLRQEQREMNTLLRRIIQKQADLEIDNTRNTLALNQQSSHIQHSPIEKRRMEQIHYLRKKAEKQDDVLQRLTGSVDRIIEDTKYRAADGAEVKSTKEMVSALVSSVEDTEARLQQHIQLCTEAHRIQEQQISSSEWSTIKNEQRQAAEWRENCKTRQCSIEKEVSTLRDRTAAQMQENIEIRGVCGELRKNMEMDRNTSRERMTACFHTVEKLETLCAAQKAEVQVQLRKLEEAWCTKETKLREESKSLFTDIRGLVKEADGEKIQRFEDLAGDLHTVKEQQRRLTEQLSQLNGEIEVATRRAVKQGKELSQRVASLEVETEQFHSVFISRRDSQREVRLVQESLEAFQTTMTGTVNALQNQVQQLVSAIGMLRKEQGDDNEWLHNELGRVDISVGYTAQQREKQERQVTSLCEIVHNLSAAVEVLQSERHTVTAVGTAPPSVLPIHASRDVPAASNNPPSWETLRSAVLKDVEVMIATKAASNVPSAPASLSPSLPPHALERMSQLLNELTAKVDGGAKYTQSIVSQQLDHVKQIIKVEVTEQLQAHSALREMAPALVELEAVKRRVASNELELQTLNARSGRWSLESVSGDLSTSSSSPAAPLQRLFMVEAAVDGLNHRLMRISEHGLRTDQQNSHLTSRMRDLETQLQEMQRAVLKLGTDLTTALESLLHTEISLTQHQSSTSSQLAEVHVWLDNWKKELAATAAASSSTLEVVQRAAASAERVSDVLLSDVQTDVARLTASLGELSSQVAQQYSEVQQFVRAELEALRGTHNAALDTGSPLKVTFSSKAASARSENLVEAVEEELGCSRLASMIDEGQEPLKTTLRALGKRIEAVETRMTELLSRTLATSAHTAAAATTAPSPDAVQYAAEMAAHHNQLEELQRHIVEVSNRPPCVTITAMEAEREAHTRELIALRTDLPMLVKSIIHAESQQMQSAWVETTVEAAVLRCRDVVASSMKEIADQTALTVVSDSVETLKGALDTNIAEICAKESAIMRELHTLQEKQQKIDDEIKETNSSHQGQHREEQLQMQKALRELESRCADLEVTIPARLSCSAAVAPETSPRDSSAHVAAFVSSKKSGTSEHTPQLPHSDKQEWIDEVLQSVQTEYYTKTFLEERLENIWASMISLLSRKEDVDAVHEKLSGLHQLLHEEMRIEVERLENQLASQLEEKVNLANLQEILEHHIVSSDVDTDDAIV